MVVQMMVIKLLEVRGLYLTQLSQQLDYAGFENGQIIPLSLIIIGNNKVGQTAAGSPNV
ncbi:hypothetical protein SAMN05192574_107101 [Mucilaginibacter gossypiicola]|uniref:Uncharacterized protein n=2 Tax=Mucilaginibacter gossypiicola TaxID=551995 RepID=A0A1H8NUR0_9SPHI|nr:hypothetical protein SAMN05192574_107101 [Mucilaginibacter gossypiicola]